MLNHRLIIGATRSGKTAYALAEARDWNGPVIYWNLQGQEVDRIFGAWTDADHTATPGQLYRPGARINYVPSSDLRTAKREIAAIVQYGMTHTGGRPWPWPVKLILDEADAIAPNGQIHTPATEVAGRGAKLNLWADFITQHPADLAKRAVRNCWEHIIYPAPYSARYYRSAGLDGELITRTLEQAPRYAYMRWTLDGRLSGPHVKRL